jgi:hypothetical protein
MAEELEAISGAGAIETHHGMSESMTLDPNGDVILAVNDTARDAREKFIVSSRVLSLASPVFSKMFSPNFKEGIQMQQGDRPCIELEEDDPKAMETILRILHYQCASIPLSTDPETLAALAIHCDKYDCNKAMKPWIAHWCNNCPGASAPEDFGFMLLAAYMFRSPAFSDIAAEAARKLTPDFASVWAEHEAIALLPDSIIGLPTPARRRNAED